MGEPVLSNEVIRRAREFHGHSCPGLAVGLRAAEAALIHLGPRSADEELTAVVETDMCGADGIQFVTGCTFGKGNLIHHDYGKNVFTFYRRSEPKALRVATRPDAFGPHRDEAAELRVKAGREGLNAAEQARLRQLIDERIEWIMAAPLEELFDLQPIEGRPPRRARIFASLTCEDCGEQMMETRSRRYDGLTLCIPCFDRRERREEPTT